ncbi:MAG: PQQ-binding-like beta-propeller repeat protein [Planctomycetota bacterium]|nr:PQQ-binding-like beta-propeller repeat protein [Planctomycetota bacterium]
MPNLPTAPRHTKNHPSSKLFICLLITIGCTNHQFAWSQQPHTDQWSMFRGPNGLATGKAASLPLEFNDRLNSLWHVATPPGHSSPVIGNNTLFLTGYDDEQLCLLAIDKNTGSVRWKRTFPKAQDEDFQHEDSCPAAPTPCTDGERVYSYFGRYGLTAHDMDGKLIWEKKYPSTPSAFGTGSSPILHDGRIYLQRDTDSLSGLYCYDAESGKEIWMTPRRTMMTSYASPFIWQSDAGSQIVAAGSGTLKGYDIANGKEIWTVRNLPVFICPSPTATAQTLVFGGWTTAHIEKESMSQNLIEDLNLGDRTKLTAQDLIDLFDQNKNDALEIKELPESRLKDAFRFVDRNRSNAMEKPELTDMLTRKAAQGRNVMVAVRSGGQGEITDTHTLWETRRMLPYVASPLIVKDRVYYAKKGGIFSCLDLKTGKSIYQARLKVPGEYYACPIRIGDHIFLGAERGTLLVLKTGDSFEVVSRNEFPEGIYATPALSDNRLFIRTKSKLYCIGNH